VIVALARRDIVQKDSGVFQPMGYSQP
jgi:hypothetical protein